jgi:GMP synthase-like glutamine amidotransferase
VHQPSKKIFSQYFYLKNDINKKYFDKREYFSTEYGAKDALDGCRNPPGSRHVAGSHADTVSEPTGNFVNRTQSKNCKRHIQR